MSFLGDNKCRVFDAKKLGKPLAVHDLCANLIKEGVWGDRLLVEKDVLLEERVYFDEEDGFLSRYYIEVIHLLLEAIHLSTNMWDLMY